MTLIFTCTVEASEAPRAILKSHKRRVAPQQQQVLKADEDDLHNHHILQESGRTWTQTLFNEKMDNTKKSSKRSILSKKLSLPKPVRSRGHSNSSASISTLSAEVVKSGGSDTKKIHPAVVPPTINSNDSSVRFNVLPSFVFFL